MLTRLPLTRMWPWLMSWRAEKGIFNMRRGPISAAMRRAGLVEPRVRRFGMLPPMLRNTSWGGALDHFAERVPPLRPVLAFQVFSAVKPA